MNSQEDSENKRWLRTGFVYGFASQNTILKQDSDYSYESKIFKFSNHFLLSTKNKHSWEILIEPSYYRSQHQLFNYWSIKESGEAADALRAKYMVLKDINEYVLNVGLIYRYHLDSKSSLYTYLNAGPMYIDTDTERLKKGFAFSDIFSFGYNYRMNTISLDAKTMIRHVSNANLQQPNFGLNSIGFEFGIYYELK